MASSVNTLRLIVFINDKGSGSQRHSDICVAALSITNPARQSEHHRLTPLLVRRETLCDRPCTQHQHLTRILHHPVIHYAMLVEHRRIDEQAIVLHTLRVSTLLDQLHQTLAILATNDVPVSSTSAMMIHQRWQSILCHSQRKDGTWAMCLCQCRLELAYCLAAENLQQ